MAYKLRLIKDIEKAEDNISNTLIDYKQSIEELRQNKKNTIMPTPGTAGAAEGGFYMLFKLIFLKSYWPLGLCFGGL